MGENKIVILTETNTKQSIIQKGRRIPLLKRGFDIGLSFLGLIISFPLWLVISFLIWFEDKGPILYMHKRVGKDGKIFSIFKFRTMIVNAENITGAVLAKENDHRITKTGKILRATAMDELPQLINIFKGDMSFVGPRPERPEFVKEFIKQIPNYKLRYKVVPGLTGIAQIYGRYDTEAYRKIRYDLLYIKRYSFMLDIKLILISFWITFRGKWSEMADKKVN